MMKAAPSQCGSGAESVGTPPSVGVEPGRAALGDGQHLAERGEVGVLPRVAAEHARQHVGGAQQQQRHARQLPRGALVTRAGIGAEFTRSSCRSRCGGRREPGSDRQTTKRQPKLPCS